MGWRALFEGSELVRPPETSPSPPMRPDRASMVLGPFAGTKGPRLPGRNPATSNITLTQELGTHLRGVNLPTFFRSNPQEGYSIHIVKLEGQNHKF